MDRRRFLRMIGASGAGIALSPLSAISLDGDWYANSRLHIKLRKPPGWHFVSVADFMRQQDEQRDQLVDKELDQEMREISGEPFLVINKYLRHEDRVTPTIQIYANPLGDDEEDVLTLAHAAEVGVGSFFLDYELEVPPQYTHMGGLLGVAWRYRYTFGDANRTPLQAWAAIGPGQRAMFSLGMVGPVEGPDESESEFESVRESLDLQWGESHN